MNNQSLKYHSMNETSVVQTTVTATISSGVDLFFESIRSPATRASYLQAIRHFEEATGFKLAKEATDGKVLQNRLIEYFISLKHSGISYGRKNVIISAVRKYVDVYEIENFKPKRVYAVMPEHTCSFKDRAYTKVEIREM